MTDAEPGWVGVDMKGELPSNRKTCCATRRAAKRSARGLAGRSLLDELGLGLTRSGFARSTGHAFRFFPFSPLGQLAARTVLGQTKARPFFS
jgi:hypothetical protein